MTVLCVACTLALLLTSDSGAQGVKGNHPTDLRYKVNVTQGGHTTESTTLVKGRRLRAGSGLLQCDLEREMVINDKTKKYLMVPFYKGDTTPAPPPTRPANPPVPARHGGAVTQNLTTTDTGERKQMFGYTARRLKITSFKESTPDACDQQKTDWEEEGWYIDLNPNPVCPDRRLPPSPQSCHDKIEIKRLGITTPVFPLIKAMTFYNDHGGPTSTSTWEVVELSTDPLDPSLFEIPPGYTEVKSRREINQAAQPPRYPARNLPRTATNRVGIELVLIPAGRFMMGSTNGLSDEKPAHQVTIAEPFYVGKYEVTQAQWQKVMRKNPSLFKADNLPVEQVSWHDAQEFIRKLNEMNDGYEYRLPSEAQWEYACRAGTTGDYAGDLDAMAWYMSNSGSQTHPLGQKQANAFGLYDMHGNVWEWCQDVYHDSYNGAPSDGSAWLSGGDSSRRVLRGGSWFDHADDLRSATRFRYNPVSRGPYGFRVVAVARR